MNLTSTSGILEALITLKEHRLKLFDLARQALKEDGTLDMEWLALHNKEINEAANEAEAYAGEVAQSLSALRKLAEG